LDRVAERPPDPDVDREEIHDTVGKVRDEVAKGDEANVAKVGQIVWIEECAPISKNKRWTLVQEASAPSA